MKGMTTCTLVLEFNYGEPKSSLGSVWLFNGDGSSHLESDEPFDSIPGWARIAGPLDYNVAAGIHRSLCRFLESCGVMVIDDAVAD